MRRAIEPFTCRPPKSKLEVAALRMSQRGMIMAFVLSSGCAVEPLVQGIEQADAIEILELLMTSGIDAKKLEGRGTAQDRSFDVHVPAADRERAYRILREHRLPRARRRELAELSGDGLIPTATGELSRQKVGVEGSLTNELRRLPGVIDAVVQVSIPHEDVFPDETRPVQRPSAAVVLIFRPTLSGEPSVPAEAVGSLVRASLPSLKSSDVAVHMVPIPEISKKVALSSRFLGLEISEGSRSTLVTLLVLVISFSALATGLAVVASLKALRYREALTRVTAAK